MMRLMAGESLKPATAGFVAERSEARKARFQPHALRAQSCHLQREQHH
jgi:hypothetical protein